MVAVAVLASRAVAQKDTKYSEVLVNWLAELGYTHCFFVAGGNIMHLLDGVRKRMTCIPTVHEVAAGVAVEYFNEAGGDGRAFALVTAGPGLTNIVTALGGAYLESRELLCIGGQVKSTDLARGEVRQRGIQEIDGVGIAAPVCKSVHRIESPVAALDFAEMVLDARRGRPGPVFIEVCLDAQGAPVDPDAMGPLPHRDEPLVPPVQERDLAAVRQELAVAQRPILLIGGGVSRTTVGELRGAIRDRGIPVMTTWNGADRFGADDVVYAGRPNTWGQRAANLLLQQADLVVALGTRLGLQQTGFNWQEFVPEGRVVQVEVDPAELDKGHPRVDVAVLGDANDLLRRMLDAPGSDLEQWRTYCREVRRRLPTAERVNSHADGFLDPYEFCLTLGNLATPEDLIIPCSSGGANSVTMQALQQREGQIIITDHGLASMGYGLSGAIGAALAHPGRRTIMVEGDGGFAQNLQELATVVVNELPMKIFLFANEGYGSIRTTQRNYFGGAYLGCDTQTGLGFPDWPRLFGAYGVPTLELADGFAEESTFRERFESDRPAAFIVPVDTEQTYFPKIASRVTSTGSMESSPLHAMSPDLEPEVAREVTRFLPETA